MDVERAKLDRRQLADLARASQRLIAIIDTLSEPTVAALHAVRWHTGSTFALRAELARLIQCVDEARGPVGPR